MDYWGIVQIQIPMFDMKIIGTFGFVFHVPPQKNINPSGFHRANTVVDSILCPVSSAVSLGNNGDARINLIRW